VVVAPRQIVASPGLTDRAARDEKVKALAADLGTLAKSALEQALPTTDAQVAAENVTYAHRTFGDADAFYLANNSTIVVAVTPSFNARGAAEVWHVADGRIERVKGDQTAEGKTTLSLTLGPVESVFVVFKEKSDAPAATEFVKAGEQSVEGPWSLEFLKGWGTPENVELPRLVSWTQHENDEVKHFSGTATYKITFDVPADRAKQAARLDLGDVQVMARVKLNGKDLGLLWKPQFRVDLPAELLKEKGNALEVAVTNLWVNRLIGDEAYPAAGEWKPDRRAGAGIAAIPDWLLKGGDRPATQRKTFATFRHYTSKDAPLLPSGMIGPFKMVFGELWFGVAPCPLTRSGRGLG
jgi:hypothetical protein